MSIVFAGLAPHPPLLIPEIGRDHDIERVGLTNQAMKKLAGLLFSANPDILVIISPHGPVFSDAIAILDKPVLEGDFAQFGVPQVKFRETIGQEMIAEIQDAANDIGIMVVRMGDKEIKQYRIDGKLDHGIMVPLSYFREFGVKAPLVPITMGMLPYEEMYRFGAMLKEVSDRLDKRVAVIASGDLSHRLTPQAPAGYNPHGQEFDQMLIKTLKLYQVESLFGLDQKLIEKAGECGLRPIIMMLGALDGLEVESEVVSYEGPFGVGYGVAAFKPTGKTAPSRVETINLKRSERLKNAMEQEHPLVRLARETIINACYDKETTPPENPIPEMERRAGVFVSIKKDGQLRGCIGTTSPTQESVAAEVIQNAISAAFYDPRFFPIEKDELDGLTISVDVLGEAEPISNMRELDPVRYGVIVRQGHKSGLLLPDLEGVDTAEEQVEIAKQKAGITSNEGVQLFRFEVIRYH